jgi:hypothetical protein
VSSAHSLNKVVLGAADSTCTRSSQSLPSGHYIVNRWSLVVDMKLDAQRYGVLDQQVPVPY